MQALRKIKRLFLKNLIGKRKIDAIALLNSLNHDLVVLDTNQMFSETIDEMSVIELYVDTSESEDDQRVIFSRANNPLSIEN